MIEITAASTRLRHIAAAAEILSDVDIAIPGTGMF
jgi:hypothetical protein